MGADGAIGKAERKLRAAVYAQITGTVLSDGEADQEPINVTRRNLRANRARFLA